MPRRGFWMRLGAGVIKPPLWLFTRHRWLGARHVPATGGVILAANHITQLDPMILAHFVYNAGRNPLFLAKESIFTVPVVGRMIRATGQIPVRRDTVDAVRSLSAAIEAVRAGGSVVIFPEGTTTREPDHWPMRGRTGVARLALETGAPVIPIATWGGHSLYDPLGGGVHLRPRAPVTVLAGPPVDLERFVTDGDPDRRELQELTDEIMYRVRDLLAEIRGGTPPPLYEWSKPKKGG